MANIQANLERKVESTTLKKLGNLGSKLGKGIVNRLGSAKKYATIAIAATGLAVGGTYVGGCAPEELTECCAQLDCDGTYGSGIDEYSCITTTNTIYKDQKCVTEEDGTQDCCRCILSKTYDGPDYDKY
ncbi:hypothetical protein HN695_05910 [Candidatus Woesearchaeota archaeon]|nr:hypothetical protein [Candidatus Woesearchaeota archaeon]MBT5272584.1 hypothetical protein [Candidatus Woesearchaeota archaeon]MBT6040559.1 hypothetical protein [Candidatus Woesearchaeota archaeon]MBT6337136.1 hypothetical protein [Candidatus Woesearchaeota archaeon]MBT7927844.1 hypothetical protein [Candidatus Woesearchaeota archaeon]